MLQMFTDGAGIQWDRLKAMGDPFIEINKIINWEIFRKPIEDAIRSTTDKSKGGRPPWDAILMFKIVMLMAWHGLSYKQAQYQINNRLDFMRFLGVELGAKLPDENTIWDFKEALREHELERKLFELFNVTLASHGIAVSEGKIVDASFVEVPRRRVIKESEVKNAEQLLENPKVSVTLEAPKEPNADYIHVIANDEKTKHILSQIDFDARFTKKGDQWYFGYKDHAVVCPVTKMIIGYDVTSAETPDCKVFLKFIDENTASVWADSAYMAEDIIKKLREINPNISINICSRAYRNKPLTDEQKQENNLISKIRARCEHVFGYMTMSMAGMKLNCIGIDRARRDIGLKNLGYNLRRLVTLSRLKKQTAPV